MSLYGIPDNYFDRTVNVERRTVTLNDIGDPEEAWGVIFSGVQATLQNLNFKEYKELNQGAEWEIENKAYLKWSDNLEIERNDRIVDSLENKTLYVVGVERYKASRVDVTTGHHVKLYLSKKNAPSS